VDEIRAALAAQHAELAGLVADLDAAGWARASACEGWTVSDVLLHLAQTDEMALASLAGRFDAHLEEVVSAWAAAESVDDGAGVLVAAERGAPADEVHRRWLAASSGIDAAFAGRDRSDRVQWVAGELSVMTLATTRLAECWIHTTDVAAGLGVELAPTDRLLPIARLAWRTIPYAFAQGDHTAAGGVAFHLTGPGGEAWHLDPADGPAATVVTGPALDLCRVAGQRADAADTALVAEGPDAAATLALVRTFA
jgi:uncharacterized protein (TIGR03084 family)